MALEGFAVISDYEQVRDGRTTFSGHGVYTYSPDTDEICLHWFDSMGSPPEVFTGGFDGEVLTLSHEGPRMHVRLIRDVTEGGVMAGRMEMSPDGQTWRTLYDSKYRRVDTEDDS